MRDRYVRWKKDEKLGKKSGAAAGTKKTAHWFTLLAFLDPFAET